MKFFSKLPIAAKLPIVVGTLSVLTATFTGVMSYQSARTSLEAEANSKLTAIMEDRTQSFQDWLNVINQDLTSQVESPTVANALVEFTAAFDRVGQNPTAYLQEQYITLNPNPTGSKENLTAATDGSVYSDVHAAYHPYFRTFLRERGYYDIFLFDTDGNLVYTVFKELDYATNLRTGEWARSDLGAAFRAAMGTGGQVFFDFAPYGPSYDAPASFIASPVVGEDGSTLGVLAFQMPVDSLNTLMSQQAGLGETGQTMIIGADGLMRSQSRFEEDNTILAARMDFNAVEAAVGGERGIAVEADAAGNDTVIAYTPFEFMDTTWALLATQQQSELLAPVNDLRNGLILQVLIFSIIVSGLGFLFSQTVTRPLSTILKSIGIVRGGDFDTVVPLVDRTDELGSLAQSLDAFRSDLSDAAVESREALFKGSAFDLANSAMMTVGRDFVINYVNVAAKDLFSSNLETFRKYFPGFDPQALVGRNIDVFHKNPSHQRGILSDPSRLPYTTNIQLDDVELSLNISAIFDPNGEYIGTTLVWEDVTESVANAALLEALDKSQAVIEFNPDGTIVRANQNFLDAMGYTLNEIVGKPHANFMPEEDRASREYVQHWDSLRAGNSIQGVFERIKKDGTTIFIEGTYSPIVDEAGRALRVVKVVRDVTAVEIKQRSDSSLVQALNKSQAVIEFTPEGEILDANDNFLSAMGYIRDEIVGKHHSTFMPKGEASTTAYRDHWRTLQSGEAVIGKFERAAKGGASVWIEAAYSPVFDKKGNVEKVVKVARDITAQEAQRKEAEALQARVANEQALVVGELKDGLRRLSDGDLTAAINASFPEDYEQIKTDFNAALSKLENVISQILGNASSMKGSVGEIAQAADDLSRRTENQAASLEETAAALNEATTAVAETASTANDANRIVHDTRTEAEESGEIVREAVQKMSEIEASSSEISQIIGVIDEIAFQTNLLALNAGVEAARAGEAGRGFAVVASEVRALAQRSSDAAKEIKDLISTSSRHVTSGVELVGQAGTALEQIVARVAEVSEMVSAINSSAQEQSRGLGEINSAVNQMDQVTQQNAAMVEESTAASHTLKSEAEILLSSLGQFNTSCGTGTAVSGARAESSNDVASQRQRAAAFATASHGSAAVDMSGDDDGWDDF